MKKIIFFFSFFLFPSLGFSLTAEQVAQYRGAMSWLYSTYARAMAVLPEGASTFIQGQTHIWAFDPYGSSVWCNALVTSSHTYSNAFDSSEYVTGGVTNSGCGYDSGYCNQVYSHRGLIEGPYISVGKYATNSNGVYVPFLGGGAYVGTSCGSWSTDEVVNFRVSEIIGEMKYIADSANYRYCGKFSGDFKQVMLFFQTAGSTVTVFGDYLTNTLDADSLNRILQMKYNFQRAIDIETGWSDLYDTNADITDFNNGIHMLDTGIGFSDAIIPPVVAPSPSIYYPAGPPIEPPAPVFPSTGVVVNVDLSTVTVAIHGVRDTINKWGDKFYDLFTSSGGVETSTSANWSDYESLVQISSGITGSIFSYFVPTSTAEWSPCFDMSGLWSGYFAGKKPDGSTGVFCLSDFSGWSTFMTLLRMFLMLSCLFIGLQGIWDAVCQWRFPTISGILTRVALTLVAVGTFGLASWAYGIIIGLVFLAIGNISAVALAWYGYTSINSNLIFVQMFNYTGLTPAITAYLACLSVRWNILLFLNFFGMIAK